MRRCELRCNDVPATIAGPQLGRNSVSSGGGSAQGRWRTTAERAMSAVACAPMSNRRHDRCRQGSLVLAERGADRKRALPGPPRDPRRSARGPDRRHNDDPAADADEPGKQQPAGRPQPLRRGKPSSRSASPRRRQHAARPGCACATRAQGDGRGGDGGECGKPDAGDGPDIAQIVVHPPLTRDGTGAARHDCGRMLRGSLRKTSTRRLIYS